jgi:hypothetical protein
LVGGAPPSGTSGDSNASDSCWKSPSNSAHDQGEVAERLVRLGHAVRLVARGHRLALALGGVDQLLGEALGHRAALARCGRPG